MWCHVPKMFCQRSYQVNWNFFFLMFQIKQKKLSFFCNNDKLLLQNNDDCFSKKQSLASFYILNKFYLKKCTERETDRKKERQTDRVRQLAMIKYKSDYICKIKCLIEKKNLKLEILVKVEMLFLNWKS